MSAAHDYSELYEIIERLESEQVDELRRHALRLVQTPPKSRFRVLRSFDGPSTDLWGPAQRTSPGRSSAKPMLIV